MSLAQQPRMSSQEMSLGLLDHKPSRLLIMSIAMVSFLLFTFSQYAIESSCGYPQYNRYENPDHLGDAWLHKGWRSLMFIWMPRFIMFSQAFFLIYLSRLPFCEVKAAHAAQAGPYISISFRNAFGIGLDYAVATVTYFVGEALVHFYKRRYSMDYACKKDGQGNSPSGHAFYAAWMMIMLIFFHVQYVARIPECRNPPSVVVGSTPRILTAAQVFGTLLVMLPELVTTYHYGYHSTAQMIQGASLGVCWAVVCGFLVAQAQKSSLHLTRHDGRLASSTVGDDGHGNRKSEPHQGKQIHPLNGRRGKRE
eukprot:Clim_evm32s134 gene=Clim_evmTU32s134